MKRKKLVVTLDSDDLKSIGHVLVRAKSDMIHMKMGKQQVQLSTRLSHKVMA